MTDDQPDRAAAVAREEAARQLVALAATLAVLPVAWWLERHMHDPAAVSQLRMRAAKAAERACATAAARLWQLAEAARRAYEAERA